MKNISVSRLLLLVKESVRQQWKMLRIFAGVLLAVILLISLSSIDHDMSRRSIDIHKELFPMLFLTLGLIYASASFNVFKDKKSGIFFLNLPASNLEKYLSRWLTSIVLYPIVFTGYYALVSLLLQSAVGWYFDCTFKRFELFSKTNIAVYGAYFAFVGFFIIGSVVFRKGAFLKTLGSLILIQLGLALLAALILGLTQLDLIYASILHARPLNIGYTFNGATYSSGVLHTLMWGARFLLFIIMPIWTWVFGYFKLKEKEI